MFNSKNEPRYKELLEFVNDEPKYDLEIVEALLQVCVKKNTNPDPCEIAFAVGINFVVR